MKVIILAGGLGTRLYEYTKRIPKPMVKISGYPIIIHIMKHYMRYGFKDFYIATMMSLLAFSLIVLSAIDFEHYIIPDEINLFIFILGFVYGVYNQIPVTDLLIMAVIYFLIALLLRFIMFAWKKKEGLGFGDVKFFAAAGVFLTDIELLPVFLFISGVAGVLIAITWKLLGKGKLFPFGPALSASLFFCVAFPEVGEKFTFFIQDSLYNN